MSEVTKPMPDGSTQPGPIQQRMTAERGRAGATTMMVVGVVWCMMGTFYFRGMVDAWAAWLLLAGYIALGIGSVVGGVRQLRRRARRIEAFDAEYGVDAGRQPTIG